MLTPCLNPETHGAFQLVAPSAALLCVTAPVPVRMASFMPVFAWLSRTLSG